MPPTPTLQCRCCAAPLSPEPFAAWVTCRHCCGVERVPLGASERPEAPRTERLRFERTPEGFRIIYRWMTPVDWLLIVMGLVLLVPLAGIVAVLVNGSLGRSATVMATWFVAGLALAIAIGLSRLFSSTVFEVRHRELIVRRRPPLSRSLFFRATEIQQLLTSEEIYMEGKDGQPEYRVYALNVVLKDGLRLKLQGRMPEAGDALFVEQQVERALGLADRPLAGEIPR